MFFFFTHSALKLLLSPVFREQQEDEAAAAGENTGTPKTSSTEAASPGKVHEKHLQSLTLYARNIIIDRLLLCSKKMRNH